MTNTNEPAAKSLPRRVLGPLRRLPSLESELRQLEQRVQMLEEELQQERMLHRRVAEVTDVVATLLLPAAGRDEREVIERIKALIEVD